MGPFEGSRSAGKRSLRVGADVVLCRLEVKRLCEMLSYSALARTMLVTAASELARNAVVHGRGGEFGWEVIREPGRVGLRLTFEDRGPGIADLGLAMMPSWTSGKGLGLGLSGAKRLVDEFSIESTLGKGTRVVVVRWRIVPKASCRAG
jgi:serine/threonine-protein kinase RsbT